MKMKLMIGDKNDKDGGMKVVHVKKEEENLNFLIYFIHK